MPWRVFARLLAMYVACLGIVEIAAMTNAELYIFPMKGRGLKPPSSPSTMAFYLIFCGMIYPFSRRYALYFFTGWTLLVPLGSLFGWGMFSWHPSWAQHLLTVAMICTTVYGWHIRDEHMTH